MECFRYRAASMQIVALLIVVPEDHSSWGEMLECDGAVMKDGFVVMIRIHEN